MENYEITKGNKLVIINENKKSIKVGKIDNVTDGKIFIKHKGQYVQIPKEKILGVENKNLILDFKDKDKFDAYKVIISGRKNGKELLIKLKELFPEAKGFDALDFKNYMHYLRFKWDSKGIYNFIQANLGGVILSFNLDLDMDVNIEENYGFVYDYGKNRFFIIPLDKKKVEILESYKPEKMRNDDWIDELINLHPIKFVLGKDFEKLLKSSKSVFEKFYNLIKSKPLDIKEATNYLLNENNYKNLSIKSIEQLIKLNFIFETDITNEDKKLFFKMSGKNVAAALIVNTGARRMKHDPLYIFKNGQNTILIILRPIQGTDFSSLGNPLKHIKRAYSLVAKLKKGLKNL